MTRILAAAMIGTLFTFLAVPDAEAKKRRNNRVKVVKKVVKVNKHRHHNHHNNSRSYGYKVPDQEYLSFGPGGISYYKQEGYRIPSYYTGSYGYGYPGYW